MQFIFEVQKIECWGECKSERVGAEIGRDGGEEPTIGPAGRSNEGCADDDNDDFCDGVVLQHHHVYDNNDDDNAGDDDD